MSDNIKEAYNKKEIRTTKQNAKKLRFLGTKGDETYLRELHNDDARLAIKIHLNMVEWIQMNYGGKGECPLCGEEDSTEHIFSCDFASRGLSVSVKKGGQRIDKVLQLFKETEERRRENWKP